TALFFSNAPAPTGIYTLSLHDALPISGAAEGSPLLHEEVGSNVLLSRAFVQGDADRALASAAVVVGDRFRFHRHAGVTLENRARSEEHTSELQSLAYLVCRLLLEKKNQ